MTEGPLDPLEPGHERFRQDEPPEDEPTDQDPEWSAGRQT